MLNKILFLIVVFLSNVIQCITGFAGTVLAMPFSVMLVGFDTARPVLNVLGLLASVFILVVGFRHIDKKEFIKITCVMAVGIAVGVFLKDLLSGYDKALYITLGILVIAFAVMNAVSFYSKKERRQIPKILEIILLLAAGTVHGIFVCGGPLLVTYASAKLPEKEKFRSTLSAVWIILNGIIFADDLKNGAFTGETLSVTAWSIAVLAAALILGNLIYKKMSRKAFLNLTYVLMIISGISLLIK
ncbi:MAG: sulfite exporter TauE/SafE family protein [Oscillospiraceae bacterium]|nr:sulfite exporter TauE/SafE family protein [Oscillospiraceae bacterium]